MKGPTFICCLLSRRWFMRWLTGTTWLFQIGCGTTGREGQTEPLPRRKPSWVPALTPDGRQGAPTSGGVIGAAVPFGTIATMGCRKVRLQ